MINKIKERPTKDNIICNNCSHSNVCALKEDILNCYIELFEIELQIKDKVNIDYKCKNFSGHISTPREFVIDPKEMELLERIQSGEGLLPL